MIDYAAGLPILGHLAAALAYGAFLLYALLRRPAPAAVGRGQQLALAAVAASLGWSLASAVAHHATEVWATYAAAALDLARYALWLMVLVWLLRPAGRHGAVESSLADRLGLVAGTLVTVIAALLMVAMWRGQPRVEDSRFYLQTWLALPLVGLVLAEQVFRNLGEDRRWLGKPICVGLACVFAFDVYLYAEGALLGGLDRDVLAARPIVQASVVPLLALATARNANWAASVQVSRRAVFYSASLVLAGCYLLFLAGIGYYVRYTGGEWGRALQFGLIFIGLLSLVMLALSASLRARVRVWVSKHFFRYRYDYREEWLAFTAMLSSDSSTQEVPVLVVRALANIVECPAGSLWMRAAAEGDFVESACWNVAQRQDRLDDSAALVRFLRERNWIIDLQEYRDRPDRYEGLEDLPGWLLSDARHWAVIPLLGSGGELLGFVVLEQPRTPVELNWEVRDLLKTASRQAAGYLAQMRATEAMLEARKFDAFNRMSAFVVHDLKNIVTQLSLMMKNARRLRDNPEFQEDMLLTVESSLERMRRMMLQLREGVAPPGGARGVSLDELVRKLETVARLVGRTLEIEVVESLVTRGHEERLERVLGHLVQNALDATPPSGRVWVKVSRYGGQIRIEIGDTGQGMSEEFVRTRLFKPFSSTKQSGMGIGTYESAHYIRELGGSIDVQSAEGRGTVLTILLPLLDVAAAAGLPASAS